MYCTTISNLTITSFLFTFKDDMEDTANTNDANEYSTGDEVEVIDIGSNQGVVIEPRSSSDTRSIRRPDEVSLFIPYYTC